MGHAKIKTLSRAASLIIWIFTLALIKVLRDATAIYSPAFSEVAKILSLYFTLPVFFIWFFFGTPLGIISAIVTAFLIKIFFPHNIYALAFIAISSFFGYRLSRNLDNMKKSRELEIEKMDEKLNILPAELKSEENNSFRMRSSMKRISFLKNIVDDYSQTLSENDVLDSVIENTFRLFEGANRALLYLVDTEKQELKLVRSKKKDVSFSVKAKRGDIFDRWVLRHGISLLVEDIHKDFRFSIEHEAIDKDFRSIISAPLISERKVTGVLRIDSQESSKFSQSDLRFLDIIANLSSVSIQNAILYKKVEDLAIHDGLTGLYVHKYFADILENEIKRSIRNKKDLSLIMVDLDDFKACNDKYGHGAGDLVLKHVSSALKSYAGPGDVISRYGGEEFALLLFGKDKKAASETAEKIRAFLDKNPLVLRRERLKITVSAGVASSPEDTGDPKELMRIADQRLYKAKETGKNRVICAP